MNWLDDGFMFTHLRKIIEKRWDSQENGYKLTLSSCNKLVFPLKSKK